MMLGAKRAVLDPLRVDLDELITLFVIVIIVIVIFLHRLLWRIPNRPALL